MVHFNRVLVKLLQHFVKARKTVHQVLLISGTWRKQCLNGFLTVQVGPFILLRVKTDIGADLDNYRQHSQYLISNFQFPNFNFPIFICQFPVLVKRSSAPHFSNLVSELHRIYLLKFIFFLRYDQTRTRYKMAPTPTTVISHNFNPLQGND